jgi:MFS family permease
VLSLASVSNEVTRELGAIEQQPWVIGSWSIASACSAALGGYLSDVFGRRNVIITGDIIVLIGSIVGATTRSIELLIVAQTLIGFGAGFVFDAFAAVPEMLPNRWRALGAGIVEGGINVPWSVPRYAHGL